MTFPKFLKIAIVPRDNIIYVNETKEGDLIITGGSEGKLIELCSQALRFSYKLMRPPDKGGWGYLVNGTWTGAMGMFNRNEVDIGISKFGVALSRTETIDYSYPYSIEDMTFAIKKPGLKSPIDALIQPFGRELWFALIVAIVIMSINFSLFHKLGLVKALEQVFAILVSQSIRTKNKSTSDKLIVLAWLSGSVTLTYSYVAILLSFLTVPLLEKEVGNVEELSAAIAAGTHKAYVYRGAIHLSDLLASNREEIKLIANFIKKHNYTIEPKRELIKKELLKGRTALISPDEFMRFFVQDEFFVSKDSFKAHPSSIVLSKSFCCRDEIDHFIHRLCGSGLYTKFVNDGIFMEGLRSKSFENSEPQGTNARSLSLFDMSGAFIPLLLGLSIALIVFAGEFIHFKMLKS